MTVSQEQAAEVAQQQAKSLLDLEAPRFMVLFTSNGSTGLDGFTGLPRSVVDATTARAVKLESGQTARIAPPRMFDTIQAAKAWCRLAGNAQAGSYTIVEVQHTMEESDHVEPSKLHALMPDGEVHAIMAELGFTRTADAMMGTEDQPVPGYTKFNGAFVYCDRDLLGKTYHNVASILGFF